MGGTRFKIQFNVAVWSAVYESAVTVNWGLTGCFEQNPGGVEEKGTPMLLNPKLFNYTSPRKKKNVMGLYQG